MRFQKITYAFSLLCKETFRSRIVLLLLLLIPTIFYLVAFYTFPSSSVLVKIASGPEEPLIATTQKELGVIYIGLAVTGFMASFLALNLMQKNIHAKNRLILCGYKTAELSVSIFLLVIIIVLVTGIYAAAIGLLMINPKHVTSVIGGYLLCGFIYGSIGLLAGALLRRELEGIMFIVLLANLDLGWLQNPIFYAASQNKTITKLLPGFDPAQVSVISAFTNFTVKPLVIHGLIYGAVFFFLSMIIFRIRRRTTNNVHV